MSKEQFPLIHRCFPGLLFGDANENFLARDLEDRLKKAVGVYGHRADCIDMEANFPEKQWRMFEALAALRLEVERLQKIVREGIDTSTDGGMDFISEILEKLK